MPQVQGQLTKPCLLCSNHLLWGPPSVGIPAAAVTAADASSTAADQLQLVNQELETLTAVLAAHQQQPPSHAAADQNLVSGGNIAFECAYAHKRAALPRLLAWNCSFEQKVQQQCSSDQIKVRAATLPSSAMLGAGTHSNC